MPFPVVLVTLCPKRELPIAKHGATIKTDNIIIGRKFSILILYEFRWLLMTQLVQQHWQHLLQ